MPQLSDSSRQLFAVAFNQIGQPVQQLPAVGSVEFAPGTRLQRSASGFDGFVDVGRRPCGDGGDLFPCGRIEGVNRSTLDGINPLVVDK